MTMNILGQWWLGTEQRMNRVEAKYSCDGWWNFETRGNGKCDDAWWDSLGVKKGEMWWRSCTMGQKCLNSVQFFTLTFAPLSFFNIFFLIAAVWFPQSTTLAHLFGCFYWKDLYVLNSNISRIESEMTIYCP